ncbi:hypothetical protein ENUP19_0012G0019 [Entamoeba nuttalli]|uniref:HEAT repeat domain containing protein n=2 Tax=Entamoeba nuttalli TaxID=412467 RepID=K2HI73_ENTNP|nr:HEAT repeat domain containing protein [Entamoeba nuttalli P19]EKE42664.1 HEAT repeat domain containing protein [Entamoeba nuttalli P19]|eukprot:XP_008854999.1 HEAT repeat domain containing protein [Entamoeba nuttalli P19]
MDVSQQHLALVIQFLEQTVSLQNQTQNTQLMSVYNEIIQYNDYIPCLLQIIATPQYKPLQQIACIFLRQSISHTNMDVSTITGSILPLLVERSVRPTAANLLCSCYTKANVQYKYQLLQKLISVLNECNDVPSIQGSLATLYMILEDDIGIGTRKELEQILPLIYQAIMNKLNHPNDEIRESAMEALAVSVFNLYDSDTFIPTVIQRYNDSSAKVRLILCQIITSITNAFPDVLKKFISQVIHVLVALTNDPNESVRIHACGVWGELCSVYCNEIKQVLPSLLQLLLPHTVLTDREIGDIGNEADDCLDGDGAMTERKQIGVSLDQMSICYGNELIGLLLPFLSEQLKSTEWKYKEAAIFVFGCIICKGWNPNNQQFNQQVKTVFIQILDKMDNSPLIQYVIMWVIQRVGSNIGFILTLDEINKVYEGVIHLIKEGVPRVKYQSLSVLSVFLDLELPFIQQQHATILNLMLEHIEPPVFVGGRVIDLISQLVDVAPELFELNSVLLKRVISQYIQYASAFPNSPQLMESVVYNLSYILPRFGDVGIPVTVSMKDFAINLLNASEGDLEMQSSCLLLLSSCLAVNPTLSEKILQMVAPSLPKYLHYLKDCMTIASYGLLGDLITYSTNEIKPIMGNVMNSLLFVLENGHPSILSNVLWSLGIIIQRYTNDMQSYFNSIYQRLLYLLQNNLSDFKLNTKRNMLICFARIGEELPDLVAPIIGNICSQLLSSVNGLSDNEALCTVILGVGRLICYNPKVCESSLNVILQIFQHSFVKYEALYEMCDAVIMTLKQTFNTPQYSVIWQNYSQ